MELRNLCTINIISKNLIKAIKSDKNYVYGHYLHKYLLK